MQLPKSLLIAQREFIKVIRKPSFWLSTLALPVLIIVVSAISGYSASSVETKFKAEAANAKAVLIMDASGLIDTQQLPPTFKLVDTKAAGVDAVQTGAADVFIYYPANLTTKLQIEIYAQDKGLLSSGIYNDTGTSLLKQNILMGLKDPAKIAAFNATYQVAVTSYKQGVEVKQGFEIFIVPLVSVSIYFMLVTFASSYLLMSVSEEKENRVIETVLSIVTPRQLILGKIIGQLGIIIMQMLVLLVLVIGGLALAHTQLPIDMSQIHVSFTQVISGLFYLVCGFLIMANTMVGVGAAMPTYKEAQNFSSIFILLSVLPIYFASILIAEPSGTIAMITSYFPFTAAMILLFRNAMGELSLLEVVVSSLTMLVYVYISFWLAYKLFEFGSLEYSRKISFKNFTSTLRRH